MENKLAQLMKQKNSQIQELLGELERIEDNFQKKCTTYESEINNIHLENKHVIEHLKESKK